MFYLASPYTDPDPVVMEQRYNHVLRITAELLNRNKVVYSPIVHCHHLATRFNLPRTFDFWMHHNLQMLARADALMVLQAHGWENSVGVQHEIDFARRSNLTIYYLESEGNLVGNNSTDGGHGL